MKPFKDRKFSNPFLIQMASSQTNKNCDLYPSGSIQKVKKCEDGHLWLVDRIDSIMDTYPTRILESMPETKNCCCCNNKFPIDWPFMQHPDDESKDYCIRCFEKRVINLHVYTCEKYRIAVRKEIKLEFGIDD